MRDALGVRFGLGSLHLGETLEEHTRLLGERGLDLHGPHHLFELLTGRRIEVGEPETEHIALARALAPDHDGFEVEGDPSEAGLDAHSLPSARRLPAEHRHAPDAEIDTVTPNRTMRRMDEGITPNGDPWRNSPVVDYAHWSFPFPEAPTRYQRAPMICDHDRARSRALPGIFFDRNRLFMNLDSITMGNDDTWGVDPPPESGSGSLKP